MTREILIVGAGPSGLTLAIELARRNIPFRIIDQLIKPAQQSKALVLHARTLELFEQIGIVEHVLQQSLQVTGAVMHLDGKDRHLDFGQIDCRYPFGIILPQGKTEEILTKRLLELGVSIERGVVLEHVRQEDDLVFTRILGKEYSFSWLVGCDGAHSSVRHELSMPFEGHVFPETFALADVQIKEHHEQDKIHLFPSVQGNCVLFPLPGGKTRIVITNVPQLGEEPTLEEIQRLAASRGCRFLFVNASWLSYFRIHSRRAAHFRDKRVFLVGDAAHVHSPAGGLGMNTGIQDAYNLGWKLAHVVLKGGPDALLDTYEEERLKVAASVLFATDLMTRLMATPSKIRNIERKWMAPLLLSCPWIQRKILERLTQLKINYRRSSLSFEEGKVKVRSGDRLPDIDPLMRYSGELTHLHSEVRGIKWQILLFLGTHRNENDEKLILDLKTHLPKEVCFHCISVETLADKELATLYDLRHVAHKTFGVKKPHLFAVRPDQYVGFSAPLEDYGLLLTYLQRLFNVE